LPKARRPYRDPPARHDLGSMDVACTFCGALHWLAERLTSSSARNPMFGGCCNSGKVHVPAPPDPPDPLKQLFVQDTVQAREFRNNIRQYNSVFAFTSLGVQIDDSVNRGPGPYVFRIHGELCHRSGSLDPPSGQPRSYAQLFVYDAQAALAERVRRNGSRREDTMALIQGVLNDSHRYVNLYKHAYETLQEHPDVEQVSLRLVVDNERDQRRYNLPTADEIAVLLPTQQPEGADRRDIILRKRDGPLQHVSECHPAYACLQYTLLFPHGEHGWTFNLPLR
ncbi:uncharacterized protein C8Q71DRAFT_676050, partial [Rhodofomes roseus]